MRAFLLCLLVACGPTIAMLPGDPPPHALHPTSPERVEVYEHREPSRPYTEVAELLAQDGDRQELIDSLRLHAANLGCDGVIVDTEIAASGPRSEPAPDAPAWWARRHPREDIFLPAQSHELDGSCIVYDR